MYNQVIKKEANSITQYCLVAFIWLLGFSAYAQEPGQVIDRIVAEVGGNVIMESEIEVEFAQMREKMGVSHDSLKCYILKQKIKAACIVLIFEEIQRKCKHPKNEGKT